MAISTSTFISDVVIFIRNLLRTNITDPLSRTNGVGFVMTAFPKRQTQYPLITVKASNAPTTKLGMQSEVHLVTMSLEIDTYGRNAKEGDDLAQDVINVLRSNQYGVNSTDVEEIHGFVLTSMVPIPDDGDGDNMVHHKNLNFEYKVILTG